MQRGDIQMKTHFVAIRYALLAGVATMALTSTAFAADKHAAAAAAEQQSLEARVTEQQTQIEAQRAEIDALKQQVKDLVGVMNQRVTKVEAQTEGGKAVMTSPTAHIEGPQGDYSLQVVGGIQASAAFYDQSSAGSRMPSLANGTEIRRGQIGIQGKAFRDFTYTAVFDLAASGGVASSVRDLTVAYTGFKPFTVTVGNQKPQSGMEASFSDRNTGQIFMEPGLSTDLATFLSTRAMGVRLSTGGDNYSASLGVYGDDINNNNAVIAVKEGWGVHGRLTYAPIATSTKVIHFGASGFWRRIGTGRAAVATDPEIRQIRIRSRPESNVDGQRLVDTGNLSTGDSVKFYGLEAAGVYGPLSVQAEYTHLHVHQNGPGLQPLNFNGAYIEGSYFLTGESRNYNPKVGTFGRVKVKNNVNPSAGTWGAWELAFRASYIDLNDRQNQLATGGVRGGYESNYTGAINWYWNPYLRFMFDYTHANVRRLTAANLNQGGNVNIYAFRIQQEW
jgi:phosphate-selective porin OprO/OprP